MTDLAKLVVRLEAQSAQLLTELEKTNNRIDRFASKTSNTLKKWAGNLAGALSAGALINFGKDVLKAQDAINDLSQKSGESVETLSRIGYAAEQSGSSLEGIAKGMKAAAKSATEAASGTGAAAKAYAALGVSVKDTDGSLKGSEELLLDVAEQLSQYEDGLAKSAIAQKIFGKAGDELIPFLNKGRAGIEELTKKADALGITMSTRAAKAADDFGDAMSTLGSITRGVVGRALEQVLPAVNELLEGFIATKEGAESLNQASRVLATGLKLLLSVGVVIGEVFNQVGNSIAASAAALTAVADGEFKRAKDILLDGNRQAVESAKKTVDQLETIWAEGGNTIVDDLEEVQVTVRKILSGGALGEGMDEFRKKLESQGKALTESLQTPLEKMNAAIATADQLLKANVITFETWQKAVRKAAADFDPLLGAIAQMGEGIANLDVEIREGLDDFANKNLQDLHANIEGVTKDIQDRFQKAAEESSKAYSVFAEQAARNTQDILADGLEKALDEGFEKGADGILESFADMLKKMVLQAIAANLAQKIFGTTNKDGSTTGGWLQAGLDWLGSMKSRDVGGRVSAGDVVHIGRGAQPEVFVPDQPGHMYPRGEGMGAGGVTQNIYTSTPVTVRSARQMQLEAARQQSTAVRRFG